MRIGLRVLLDSGSTHSFILKKWVARWNLKVLGECIVDIATFGKKSSGETTKKVVEVEVFKNLTSPDSTDMTLIAMDNFITEVNCHKLSETQRQVMVNNNYQFADPEVDNDGKLPIDMLVGQDFYNSLLDKGEVILVAPKLSSSSLNVMQLLTGK